MKTLLGGLTFYRLGEGYLKLAASYKYLRDDGWEFRGNVPRHMSEKKVRDVLYISPDNEVIMGEETFYTDGNELNIAHPLFIRKNARRRELSDLSKRFSMSSMRIPIDSSVQYPSS